MPRVAPKQAVEPQAFRHVAILTIAAAGVLALFASGESRQDFEDELARKSEQKRLEEAELKLAKQGKGGNTTVVFKDNRTGSWGSVDTGEEYEIDISGEGAPELTAAPGPRFVTVSQPGQAHTGPSAAPPGMSADALEEIAKKKKKKIVPPKPQALIDMEETGDL
jgi:hypothetical protein